MFNRSLTEKEMSAICKCARNTRRHNGRVAAIFFYHRIAGREWPLQAELKPDNFKIPQKQWKDICQAILDGQQKNNPSSFSIVGEGLSWMNIGPGTQE